MIASERRIIPPPLELRFRRPGKISPAGEFDPITAAQKSCITSDCRREMRSYISSDLRKDIIDLARRRRTTLGVRADHHRLAARGPGHGDVASGVFAVVAGL